MAVSKIKKQEIIEGLRENIAKQKAIVLVGITGLKVKDLSVLRKKLKGVDAKIQVVKKTLASLVLKEKNFNFNEEQFKEEIAFVFGFGDEVLPAKTVYQLSLEKNKVKILGGFFENQFKSKEEMILLAQLPTREELLAKLVGSIASPISNFVYALQYNLKGLVYLLSSINK
ncbi:MAG: 50S ribosomal protein L10 [bacterium]|nr:50S ribosomal protein L10 [bacterium]